jgi:adenine-specific DNA methylase
LTTIRQKIKGYEATTGLEKEIKKNTERIFFASLLRTMANKSTSSGVLAACKGYIKSITATLTGIDDQSVYLQSLIEDFQKDPSKFEVPEVKAMPDGAPIGCFDE